MRYMEKETSSVLSSGKRRLPGEMMPLKYLQLTITYSYMQNVLSVWK